MTGAFHSRLLRKVEQDIAQAQLQGQQLQALCLRARRCGLLARQGQLELARSELTPLHQAAFASPHPKLGAWLHPEFSARIFGGTSLMVLAQ